MGVVKEICAKQLGVRNESTPLISDIYVTAIPQRTQVSVRL
jgi:hypothetical protein